MAWFKDSWGKDTSFDDEIETKFWKKQEEERNRWWESTGKKNHEKMMKKINRKKNGNKSIFESILDLFS